MERTRGRLLLASVLLIFSFGVFAQSTSWQLVPPSQVPETATFWIFSWSDSAPIPFNPCPSCNVYSIGDGHFVVDDLEVAATRALMAETQEGPPPPDGGEGGTNVLPGFEYTPPVYGSNDFYLSISNAGGIALVGLHNVEQRRVYALESTTSLVERAWTTEQSLHAWTNQALIETTIPVSLETEGLFLRARDWTDDDTNTNAIPDWWEWENFGSLQMSDGDYDNDGLSDSYEYWHDSDPNTIVFTATASNRYVSQSSATAQLAVTKGVPSEIAILVDNTNLSAATWAAYSSSNIALSMGTVEGWHEVWVGLRGHGIASQASWAWTRLKLDTVPPSIVITSPSTVTIAQPMIQVQGYSLEMLARISYDLTNTSGVLATIS